LRHPHHTISNAGLVGGGSVPQTQGEVSMAHNGVIVELPEFPRNVLEVTRQPLEERRVTIARAHMTLTFPAAFVLVAGEQPLELRCLFAIKLNELKPKAKGYPKKINTIGDHIRKKRLDLDLLQEHVAAQIGVAEITICNWETNRYEPQRGTYRRSSAS
jgi:predicted ATPase with chaperone activity